LNFAGNRRIPTKLRFDRIRPAFPPWREAVAVGVHGLAVGASEAGDGTLGNAFTEGGDNLNLFFAGVFWRRTYLAGVEPSHRWNVREHYRRRSC
jgi:hypothetical protein